MFTGLFEPIWKCDLSIDTARVYVKNGKYGKNRNFSKKKPPIARWPLGDSKINAIASRVFGQSPRLFWSMPQRRFPW
jgi:hypothetical protein